ESGAMTLSLDHLAAEAEAVEIAGWSGRFAVSATTGIMVVVGQGVITITIADEAGKVLSGAVAVLDGNRTAIADASGRVTFSGVRSGSHTVDIRATGYAPYTIQVSV
ncbi:MAG TPA: carboxypeptidase-like regulatory domain-containing protein, partial [Geobacteraceae bacterium]|nr:carboxypeptidase-like regulatory domain-containing protein [Geobacteraceae bacterium]